MKPVYLSFENLKGRDGQYELKPVNIFIGPNGIGKSTILWAVEVALLGYHPSLGKQNQATSALMGDHRLDMNVCLRFDDSSSNQISWTRKSDGDVKKSSKMDHDDVPDIMFDLHQYLGLTNKERIKLISDKIGKSDVSFDEPALIAKLKAIEVIPAAECTKVIQELIKFADKSILTRTKSKQSIQDWLCSFASELTEETKRFKNLRQNSSAQLLGLRGTGAATPKSVDDKLRTLYEQRGQSRTRLTELTTLQKQISQTSQRRAELEQIIALQVPETAEWEKFSQELTAELKAWIDPMPKITRAIEEKKNEVKKITSEMDGIANELVEIKKKLAGLVEHQKCPYCKSNRQGWKTEFESELKSSLAEKETTYKTLGENYDKLIAEGKALRAKEDAAKKETQDISSKKSKRDEIDKKIADATTLKNRRAQNQAELAGLTAATGTVDAKEMEELQINLDKIEKEIGPLEEQEKLVKSSIDNRNLMLSTEKDLLSHQTREEVFKQAAALVLAEQEKIVETAFSSILVHARKFTDGILPGELLYRDGDLGMQTPRGWVAHKVMGTTHQTLAYIGVSIALAQQSPTKIVVLDEAGIIHPKLKPAIIIRLLELAAAKVIDAAFLTDPTGMGYEKFSEVPDVQLVEFTDEEAAANVVEVSGNS